MLTESQIKCDVDTICGDANYSQLHCDECSKHCFLRGLADQAILAIQLQAEVDRLKRGWISVNERLPENNTDIVIFAGKVIKIAYFYAGRFHDELGTILYGITHYRKLPQPPEGT